MIPAQSFNQNALFEFAASTPNSPQTVTTFREIVQERYIYIYIYNIHIYIYTYKLCHSANRDSGSRFVLGVIWILICPEEYPALRNEHPRFVLGKIMIPIPKSQFVLHVAYTYTIASLFVTEFDETRTFPKRNVELFCGQLGNLQAPSGLQPPDSVLRRP